MFWAKKIIVFVLIFLAVFPFCATSVKAVELLPPVLSISPREINLGTIITGEAASGLFTLTNMGSGSMEWSTRGPEGWKTTVDSGIITFMQKKVDYLRIEVRSLPDDGQLLLNENNAVSMLHSVEMKLESEAQAFTCSKRISEGMHKEAIKINSAGGNRTIFVTFSIASTQKTALIHLNPKRIDMGTILQGEKASKKIILTNTGKETLNWSVAVEKSKRFENPANFKKGRYLSFFNEDVANKGVYNVPSHLKEVMELSGKWTENEGYPSGGEGDNLIKLAFNGSGIVLYFVTYPDMSNFDVYLDDRPVSIGRFTSGLKEEKEKLLIAEGLVYGSHVLNIVSKDSRLVFEGVKILGKSVNRAPYGKTTIVPTSGTTLTQTNYLRVTFNSENLDPGYYGENIIFTTNNGEAIVELFAEVVSDKITKDIDIYRYSSGDDYLFTANPLEDRAKLGRNNYKKDGIAFRLLAPGTPGTTPFYRWYNIRKRDHFYHHDQTGDGKNLQGYVFEGSIGNIATSKLTNTRELYRWYNSSNGRYFYTTDSRAADIRKKGYSFNGIAGYVK